MRFNHTTFVTIDFESYNPGVWWTCAIVAMEYRSGKVKSIQQFACDRTNVDMCVDTQVFWKGHEQAFLLNQEYGKGRNVENEEKKICEYIQQLKETNPSFYLVSDSPSHDVQLIDSILRKHGHDPISKRSETKFHQTVCTWSFRLAVGHLFNVKPRSLLYTFRTHTTSRKIESELRTGFIVFEEKTYSIGPPHTPLYDCFHILLNHFKVLDIASHYLE
jgi:hypothetical protein